ncbi:YciI family protein [Capnocytophaga gingivalis]|jgi:GTP cyclohydrolase II|uniref:YciI family protein n=1 Tax=Capnocytophaga gingivalis TaxID=1017 RepID=UPI0023F324FF|nr:YciI family protein [Capnocytophaga gingivalis]
MYIIILTYQKNLSEVEKHLEAHRAYLDRHYASGHFIASGAQVPRKGGVILCKADSKEEILGIIAQDPFHEHRIAAYQIIEFTPTKFSEAFEKVLS